MGLLRAIWGSALWQCGEWIAKQIWYFGCLWAWLVIHLNPTLIAAYRYEIIALFVMEGLCYGVSFWRFGKETCTHAFLSKLWGVCLLVAFISLIGFGYGGFPLLLAVYWGLFSQLDVILIILLLPKWQNDIPSSYHAYLLRKGKEIKKHKLFN